MPNVEKRKITGKVAGGFFILLLLVAAAIYLLLFQANKAKPYREAAELAGKKAAAVNTMLSRLLEEERLGRAFLISADGRFLKAYLNNLQQLKNDLELLKQENAENKNQLARIQRVDVLITQKQRIFESMFALKKQYILDTLTRDSILNFAQRISDSIRVTKTILDRHTIERIPITMEPEKKTGFLKRFWNSITGDKDEEEQPPTSLPKIETRLDTSTTAIYRPDTTIAFIKKQLIGFRQKELLINKEISRQERRLQINDQQIANDIRKLLYLIEQEELRLSSKRSQQTAALQQKLYIYSLGLGFSGLLTILIFSVLIMRDLTRSEYYRQELEAARALAEEHLKVKEQFMATMSHEIRTPITSIIGFSEQLGQTKLTNQQLTYQSIITKSSEHLLGLINDILDFSKIEAGMIKLECTPFSPYETLMEAIEIVAPKARDKKLSLYHTIEFKPTLAFKGDPLRLRQLAINLLGNAVKFTESGSVKLKASTEKLDGKTLQLRLFIEDTGIGIPMELQSEIFKEFTQTEAGITRKYGGTGLGLAISKRLVELQNGKIGVTSIPGKGSEFYVVIPYETTTDEIREQKSSYTQISANALNGFQILLAEDDATTQLLTKGILEKYGAAVDSVSNGLQALALLKENGKNYHLLISDVQMPEMGGLELVQRVMTSTEWKHTPTLCVTANNTEAEKRSFIGAGFSEVLVKPFYEHQLLEKVEALLNLSFELTTTENQTPQMGRLSFAGIRQFTGDDSAAYTAVLLSLKDNIEMTSKRFEEALKTGNQNEISNLAHRILPHFSQLKATELTILLTDLEELRKKPESNVEIIEKKVALLIEHLSDAARAIEAELLEG